MSSPGARQRRRRDQYQAPRTRSEVAIAVSVGAGIVIATAVMIWLLRPGGMADRQPRSSWLVALTLIALIVAVTLILRAAKKRELNTRLWLAGSFAGILVVAVVAGIFWPRGLLRHTPPLITVPPTSTTAPSASTSAPTGSSTTQPGSSTTKPATATTGTTTVTTTAATTAPTSSSP